MFQLKFYEALLILALIFNFQKGLVTATSSLCDVDKLRNLEAELIFDSAEIDNYQYLIKTAVQCSKGVTNNKDKVLFLQLRNQITYKLGLLQLSLNQNLKALELFESLIIKDEKFKDSYTELAHKRLDELYIEFGYWEKLQNDEDDLQSMFKSLNSTLNDKIVANMQVESVDKTLQDELKPMLQISPYDLKLLTVNIEYLTKFLSETLDPFVANELLKNYEIVLDQYKTKLNLTQRLEIHYIISIVQMFILNTDPSNQLRKCLAIDMDYSPCKQLTVLNSRLGKVNPHKSQLLDPQVFAFSTENSPDQISSSQWEELLNFYLDGKSKPCLRIPLTDKKKPEYEFVNNYKLVNDYFIPRTVKTLFENLIPLGNSRLFTMHYDPDNLRKKSYFNRYINVAICESTKHSSRNIVKSLSATKYCKESLKQVLSHDQWTNFKNAVTKLEPLSDHLLEDLWNTYPTLTIHVIDMILHKNKKQTYNKLMEQIVNFFNEQKLGSSENKRINKQVTHMRKMLEKVNKNNQHQQQQQQQQFHFNFGQQGNQYQQQQQQQQAPPPQATNKDYYKILGVGKDADSKAIRKAYLNLTKKYHPDKQGALSEDEKKSVHEKMSEINEAYETLSDDEKKGQYDAVRSGGGNRQFHQQQFQQGSPFGGGNPMNFMFQQGPGGRAGFPFGM
ncbi:dnaJ-like chaperone Jem1p [Monosporozyma unispora]